MKRTEEDKERYKRDLKYSKYRERQLIELMIEKLERITELLEDSPEPAELVSFSGAAVNAALDTPMTGTDGRTVRGVIGAVTMRVAIEAAVTLDKLEDCDCNSKNAVWIVKDNEDQGHWYPCPHCQGK